MDDPTLALVAPDPCSAVVVQASSSPTLDQSTAAAPLLPTRHHWSHPTYAPSPPRPCPHRSRHRRPFSSSTAGRCTCPNMGGGGGCGGESSIILGLEALKLHRMSSGASERRSRSIRWAGGRRGDRSCPAAAGNPSVQDPLGVRRREQRGWIASSSPSPARPSLNMLHTLGLGLGR